MSKEPQSPDEVRKSAPRYADTEPRPPGAVRRMTIEEFERMPDLDEYRHELVRGWLVREPPPVELHGSLQLRLGHHLLDFVERNRLGLVVTESGYVLSEQQQTVRGPDVAFVAAARLEGGPLEHFRRGAPDLAVEILSPSNRRREVAEKVTEYLAAGARAVWVVDPRKRSVAVHRTGVDTRIYRAGETLDGGEVLPGFRLPLSKLFVAFQG